MKCYARLNYSSRISSDVDRNVASTAMLPRVSPDSGVYSFWSLPERKCSTLFARHSSHSFRSLYTRASFSSAYVVCLGQHAHDSMVIAACMRAFIATSMLFLGCHTNSRLTAEVQSTFEEKQNFPSPGRLRIIEAQGLGLTRNIRHGCRTRSKQVTFLSWNCSIIRIALNYESCWSSR